MTVDRTNPPIEPVDWIKLVKEKIRAYEEAIFRENSERSEQYAYLQRNCLPHGDLSWSECDKRWKAFRSKSDKKIKALEEKLLQDTQKLLSPQQAQVA